MSEEILGLASEEIIRKYENLKTALRGNFATVINFLLSRVNKSDLNTLEDTGDKTTEWRVSAPRVEMEAALYVLDQVALYIRQTSRSIALTALLMACGISFSGNFVKLSTPLFGDDLLSKLNGERRKHSGCDLDIIIGEKTHPAHKSVLTAASLYFAQNCNNETFSINISYVVDNSAFEIVLDFMYTGTISINKENINLVKDCAGFLGIRDLFPILKTYEDIGTFNHLSKARVIISSIDSDITNLQKQQIMVKHVKKRPLIHNILDKTPRGGRKRINYRTLAGLPEAEPSQEFYNGEQPDTQVVVHIDGNHLCDKCNKPFDTMLSLTRHKASCGRRKKSSHHAKIRLNMKQEQIDDYTEFKCDTCDLSFSNILALSQHKTTCNSIEELSGKAYEFNCENCGEGFDFMLALVQHKNTECFWNKAINETANSNDSTTEDNEASPSQFKCDMCNLEFHSALLMAQHRITVCGAVSQELKTPDKKVPLPGEQQCDSCGETFKFSIAYKAHVQACKKSDPVYCDMCPQSFDTKEELLKHFITHESFSMDTEVEPEKNDIEIPSPKRPKISKTANKPIERIKRYKCRECDKILSSKRALKLHLVKHRICPTEDIVCSTCDAKFSIQSKLDEHIRLKHGGEDMRDYPCIICGRQFGQLEWYLKHTKSAHHKNGQTIYLEYANKEVKCGRCGFLATNIDELKTHCEIHKDKYFQCNVCEATMKGSNALTRHMLDMHEVKIPPKPAPHRKYTKVDCEICGKLVARRAYRVHYFQHVKTPADVPQGWPYFQCNECGKMYPQQYMLEEHLTRWHSGKDYVCEICAKTFGNAKDCQRHVKSVHETEKQPCDVCGKEFSSKFGLKIHKFTHEDIFPFHCGKCDQYFRTKGSFTHHERMHFFEKTCNVCNKVLRPSAYKRHMSLHASNTEVIECDECGEIFGSKDNHDKHKKCVHGPRHFECSYCDKVYGTEKMRRNHEKLHTGVGAYKCEVCEKLFPNPSGLRNHFKKHTGQKDYQCNVCHKWFSVRANKDSHERNCILKQKGVDVKVSYNPAFLEQIGSEVVSSAIDSIADTFNTKQYEIATGDDVQQQIEGVVHEEGAEQILDEDERQEIQFEIIQDENMSQEKEAEEEVAVDNIEDIEVNLEAIEVETTLAGHEEVI